MAFPLSVFPVLSGLGAAGMLRHPLPSLAALPARHWLPASAFAAALGAVLARLRHPARRFAALLA